MTQTLSHQFITALSPHRDRLYTLALAASSESRAEPLLQSALRDSFTLYTQNPTLNPIAGIERSLQPSPPSPESAAPIENQKWGGVKIENQPMPADLWARLVAAVQIEAARSEHSRALNPDSVLLTPDPLLAPKKPLAAGDAEAFDLPPTSRFFLAGLIVILLALALTLYLLTRPINPTPATHPAPTAKPTLSTPANN